MAKTKAEIQRDYSKRSGYAAQKKYDITNRCKITLNLNLKYDADIFQAIEGKQTQTELKRLIRLRLEKEKESILSADENQNP